MLLQVEDLHVHFPVHRGTVFKQQVATLKAVNGVSLAIEEGKTLGLVGESGCGKSTLGRGIIRLYKPAAGKVTIDGEEISSLSHREMKQARAKFQMIFQDPYSSLNPRLTVYEIISEPLITNMRLSKKDLQTHVLDAMDKVKLAQKFIKRYPHEFSGGQRQRIAIARALALKPKLIICDEPVSALDVSIQSQILNLLVDLQKEFNISYLFISHDLSVVKHVSQNIAVMYLGKIVEIASKESLFSSPKHPYTQALLNAILTPDPKQERSKKRLVISAEVPDAAYLPTGCSFNTRCVHATDKCFRDVPMLKEVDAQRKSACFLH